MKNKRALRIFAIFMSALMVFSGSAVVAPPPVEAFGGGGEQITLTQIRTTMQPDQVFDVDDGTLENNLSYPKIPGVTLRQAAESMVAVPAPATVPVTGVILSCIQDDS